MLGLQQKQKQKPVSRCSANRKDAADTLHQIFLNWLPCCCITWLMPLTACISSDLIALYPCRLCQHVRACACVRLGAPHCSTCNCLSTRLCVCHDQSFVILSSRCVNAVCPIPARTSTCQVKLHSVRYPALSTLKSLQRCRSLYNSLQIWLCTMGQLHGLDDAIDRPPDPTRVLSYSKDWRFVIRTAGVLGGLSISMSRQERSFVLSTSTQDLSITPSVSTIASLQSLSLFVVLSITRPSLWASVIRFTGAALSNR
ncbi:hypothetical protein K431DRAFT_160636 [Polychaeton citri CBS 116435]|uniref:Uncharacterized protein n=1 Tax=Polychaeton citri CBS 116435 TaxID=1314669 RepID=A0A9P4UIV2_9PEZI|nr:hypothetical protein K431DRAFT_160636 [Polychaeton citri CBS 116435]